MGKEGVHNREVTQGRVEEEHGREGVYVREEAHSREEAQGREEI